MRCRNAGKSSGESGDEDEFGIHAAAPFGDGNASIGRSRWLERKLIGKFAQPIGDSVPVEEFAPFQVGLSASLAAIQWVTESTYEVDFLGTMRLANDHLAGREEAGDEVTDHGVQVELFGDKEHDPSPDWQGKSWLGSFRQQYAAGQIPATP